MLSGADIAELLDRHDLRPSKGLGQNFVADPNTVRRIARLAGVGPGDRVVEVGPGLGSLTLALAETGAGVVAVEVDHRLVPVLARTVAGLPVVVVEDDALRCDWERLLDDGAGALAARPPGRSAGAADASGLADARADQRPADARADQRPADARADQRPADAPWCMVANLPYNVATAVVLRALEEAPAISRFLVMVQREVGERWAAGPRGPAYGAVSVKVAYFATAELVGRVPANVFIPRPSVESVLVRLIRHRSPIVPTELVGYDRFRSVVGAGFAQRRKMLRRALAGTVEPQAFERAGIAPERRAEELGVEEWGRLAAVGGGGTASRDGQP